jgi:streptomycin 6-kinase
VPASIEQLADGLGQPVDRIVAWGFVMAVLSEVWTTEGDGVPGSRPLDVARLLLRTEKVNVAFGPGRRRNWYSR